MKRSVIACGRERIASLWVKSQSHPFQIITSSAELVLDIPKSDLFPLPPPLFSGILKSNPFIHYTYYKKPESGVNYLLGQTENPITGTTPLKPPLTTLAFLDFKHQAAEPRHCRRSYCCSSQSESESGRKLKHQEIEGPTVERDVSPLANETREVTQSMMKTMYSLSKALALLGLSQLALGSLSSDYYSRTIMSAVAFGLPFSMAFLLRQSLKSMHFFHKMEQLGRLQILTCTMQISKNLRLFFLRLRAVSYLCLAGVSLTFFYSLFSSLSSASS